ncbi:MAG: DUF4198 domain-containing protein [Rhodocyclaceae bacterium]|nr:DUF4198 domain-containing protein [Rhodocyclaceae bacterium]
MRRFAPWLLLAFCMRQAAFAHDLWLEKEGLVITLYQGHKFSAHGGAETLAYGQDFVQEAHCFDLQGKPRPLEILSRSPWRARGDCAISLLVASSGYWSKTPWETRNAPKSETPGAIKSWRTIERLKRLERWSEHFASPLGKHLEIVPESNPFAVKPQEKLMLRVFFDGKPLSGVPVAYRGQIRGETDAQGRIAIRLRQAGIQWFSTSLERPVADDKADVEIVNALLQFELAP